MSVSNLAQGNESQNNTVPKSTTSLFLPSL